MCSPQRVYIYIHTENDTKYGYRIQQTSKYKPKVALSGQVRRTRTMNYTTYGYGLPAQYTTQLIEIRRTVSRCSAEELETIGFILPHKTQVSILIQIHTRSHSFTLNLKLHCFKKIFLLFNLSFLLVFITYSQP